MLLYATATLFLLSGASIVVGLGGAFSNEEVLTPCTLLSIAFSILAIGLKYVYG